MSIFAKLYIFTFISPNYNLFFIFPTQSTPLSQQVSTTQGSLSNTIINVERNSKKYFDYSTISDEVDKDIRTFVSSISDEDCVARNGQSEYLNHDNGKVYILNHALNRSDNINHTKTDRAGYEVSEEIDFDANDNVLLENIINDINNGYKRGQERFNLLVRQKRNEYVNNAKSAVNSSFRESIENDDSTSIGIQGYESNGETDNNSSEDSIRTGTGLTPTNVPTMQGCLSAQP